MKNVLIIIFALISINTFSQQGENILHIARGDTSGIILTNAIDSTASIYIDTTGNLIIKNDTIKVDAFIRFLKLEHAIFGCTDSATTITVTTQNTWYQVTNSFDSLFVIRDIGYMTYLKGDTIRVDNPKSYLILLSMSYTGASANTVVYKSRIVADGNDISFGMPRTTSNNSSTGNISHFGYLEADGGEKIWIEIENTTGTEDVVINAVSCIIIGLY